MTEWQHTYGVDDKFNLKVIELFRAVEDDLKQAFSRQNGIYSTSYKVGVIGDQGVGKSALIKMLGNIDNQFFSTVSIDRSTFGYLQFDTLIRMCPHMDKTLSITFIDIEGATDMYNTKSAGSFIELIAKANCDLYLIVFDRPFNNQHCSWKTFIEQNLRRKCLLVWSKTDELFLNLFKDQSKKPYNTNTKELLIVKDTLKKTRRHTSITYDRELLTDNVYLTAANCDKCLTDAPFATFDLNQLKKKILKMVIEDPRAERMHNLATLSSIVTINTCFRRGYMVSTMRYRLMAAAVAAVPFLQLVPEYFGRKKIHHAFGIYGTLPDAHPSDETTLETYLKNHNFTVYEDLYSGCFDYLTSQTKTSQTNVQSAADQSTTGQLFNSEFTSDQSTTSQSTTTKSIKPSICTQSKQAHLPNSADTTAKSMRARLAQVLALTGTVFSKLGDDAARIFIPATTITSKTLLIASNIVGAALIPVFAFWSFYSTKNHFNNHLQVLCNDLSIVFEAFVAAVCNDCLLKQTPPEVCSDCLLEDEE